MSIPCSSCSRWASASGDSPKIRECNEQLRRLGITAKWVTDKHESGKYSCTAFLSDERQICSDNRGKNYMTAKDAQESTACKLLRDREFSGGFTPKEREAIRAAREGSRDEDRKREAASNSRTAEGPLTPPKKRRLDERGPEETANDAAAGARSPKNARNAEAGPAVSLLPRPSPPARPPPPGPESPGSREPESAGETQLGEVPM